MTDWTLDSAPRLTGQRAVITGATGGLGLATAQGLAALGATVLLTGRNPDKGRMAVARLRSEMPDADVGFAPLDMASLTSIADFADTHRDRVDILVNNAGVMGPRTRMVTQDGFELQFGTNHLGHFALTGRLLPMLEQGRGIVVTVASLAAWGGTLPFDDLNARHHYSAFQSYRRSKLANLLFARELARRAALLKLPIHSRAAHPGWSSSDIIANTARLSEGGGALRAFATAAQKRAGTLAFRMLGQDVDAGALPTLYAALSDAAQDGGYYGPQGSGERRGPPGEANVPPSARDPELAKKLWDVSERMTGVQFADV
ncbi:SDR family oxidoreductase [Tanticharoenia sakaeratensis]|uniref:Oxidoreductase n=1 Tax=Tanticharoenia sakaeratensis NBRC 103193 TaxID=1231623 RepID=A0A0D6MJI5_9PROT|nr:SDR family oxidoreductase [Tanticharoenia sakaeratensis]GAN53814.1 oxidoreductase [Tanticharoenia sakaeratensis NBRC 103193]GBQ22285.1 oxidoreductase [Tanticharoenia sakaeratensis NBRC 103193]